LVKIVEVVPNFCEHEAGSFSPVHFLLEDIELEQKQFLEFEPLPGAVGMGQAQRVMDLDESLLARHQLVSGKDVLA